MYELNVKYFSSKSSLYLSSEWNRSVIPSTAIEEMKLMNDIVNNTASIQHSNGSRDFRSIGEQLVVSTLQPRKQAKEVTFNFYGQGKYI
jgi:hypothetical protein